MSRNLIKQRAGNDGNPVALPISNPAAEHCGEETATFAKSIAAVMEVKPSGGVAKVPSVLSPIYSFYINMAPTLTLGPGAGDSPGLSAAHKRAKEQFRGIAAALLLRDILGLKIEKESFPLNAMDGLRNRFGSLVQAAPGFNLAPWNVDLHFLTLNSGGVKEPLAVLSPYTLFCPAATTMQHCRSLFWYTEQGIWLDPTANDPAFDNLKPVVKAIRRSIFQLLMTVVPAPGNALAWPGLNLVPGSAKLITDELQSWKSDIQKAEVGITPDGSVAAAVAPLAAGFGDGASPLLDHCLRPVGAVPHGPAAPPPVVDPRLLTDLPIHKGRLLVSTHLVSDGTRRLCGQQMGNSAFVPCLNGLPLFGDQLSLTDGVRHFHINYPYLNVEKAFLDKLYQIADGDVSPVFRVLRTENPPTSTFEYWFLPVKSEALSYLDIEGVGLDAGRIESFPTCQRRQDGQNDNRVVTINLGGNPFVREYGAGQRDGIFHPNLLDIRIWPRITAPQIDCHYWRVRQLPVWDLTPSFLARNSNEIRGMHWIDAWTEDLNLPFPVPNHVNAKFYKVPVVANSTPVGVEFPRRGVVLLKLPTPPGAMAPTPCVLAVDFGTSNTCVVVTPVRAAGDPPVPLRFEIQTASLHGKPTYHGIPNRSENGFTEGGAPVFDFPVKYEDEAWLADGDFFPTLFAAFTDGELVLKPLTGSTETAQRLDTQFRLSYGRLYPRNVMFGSGYIHALLRDSPLVQGLPAGNDTRSVFLFDDIKHKNLRYRKAFLWDLAMLVKVATCQANQQITQARFSFPRAFLQGKLSRFKGEAVATFVAVLGIRPQDCDFMTESHAVYRHTLTQNQTDHLVLDIGGGTTDFLATFPAAPAQSFQASYELAARVLNDYFVTSRVFRHIFNEVVAGAGLTRDARQRLDALSPLVNGLNTVGGGNTSYGHQGFFGLLSLLNDQQYNTVFNALCATPGAGKFPQEDVHRAVRGFLYSVLLLYGGLVYSAGLLMRERNVQSTALDIDLIGNGSKLYLLMRHIAPNAQEAVDGLFASLLAAAWGATPRRVRVVFHADGKTFVSKGLSATSTVAAPPVGFLDESFKYLSGQTTQRPVAASDQSELRRFIEAVSGKLPGGNLMIGGHPHPLIPFCAGPINQELLPRLEGLQVAFQAAEQGVIADCTADYQNAVNPNNAAAAAGSLESAQAREPLFIIHLRALLNHIRTQYGV